MFQIIQNLKSGETILEQVPAPQIKKGAVLIQTTRSLVSLGTERMLVEFGKSNLIAKARQQPDKVKQVLNKIKTEGILPTLEAVFNKLDQPLPLGYCNVGKVIAVGDGVTEFKVGDRVASNGHHAEFVCIPKNLVARIPDEVSDEDAAFTVIGSIGLQGIRLLNPTFGETVVVIGMGLIGLITAQLLIANGCKVIGVDLDEEKLKLSESWGVIPFDVKKGDIVKFVEFYTNSVGADGVLITASAKNDNIISQSAQMTRKRGRIVLVGVVGLNLSRAEFYQKELSFQVSCSYGPGRYDEDYEQQGNDYPLPFVRWTEKRNFETILNAIAGKKLVVKDMISNTIALEDYDQIYGNISNSKSIASILKYTESDNLNPINTISLTDTQFTRGKGVIGIIGAGNFTKMTMLPALKNSGAGYKYIASASGVTGTSLAKKFGFAQSTTDYKIILNDTNVDLVLITTQHDKHADIAVEALNAGKHVFVEKPLALNDEQLEKVIGAYYDAANADPVTLTVGFNRRFSPHAVKIKSLVGNEPMNVIATMNAGHVPPNVWVHNMQVGGGRIIGEACHFIDLITYFTGGKVTKVCMNAMGTSPEDNTDNASILLKYDNGSTGVINYFSNGNKSYEKERIEVYSQERIAIIDNFKTTTGYGFKGFSKLKTQLDKGHKNQFQTLINHLKNGGHPLIPFDEIVNTTRASFAAIESLKQGKWIDILL